MPAPTSGWLIGAAALLLAVVLAWALVRLPRRRTTPWRDMLRQALALVLGIGLSLLLVGLVLNRSNDWYATWSDIFAPTGRTTSALVPAVSTMPSPVHGDPIATRPATGLQANPVDNRALTGYDPAAKDGQYLQVTITGPATGLSQKAMVWLPPSYPTHPNRFYPVLLAFTGTPGDPSAYRDRLEIGRTLATLAEAGVLRDTIVVVPKTFPGNSDGECVDGTVGSHPLPWETYVDTEVRAWTVTNLRALPTADAWATLGYSAGAFCAAMMPLRHPNHYRHGLVLSGYFAPEWGPGGAYRPAGDPTYDLAKVAERNRPPVQLWVYLARDDRQAVQALTAFTPAVQPPTRLSVMTQDTGGHRWGVWTQGTPLGLTWLGATAPAFAGSAA